MRNKHNLNIDVITKIINDKIRNTQKVIIFIYVGHNIFGDILIIYRLSGEEFNRKTVQIKYDDYNKQLSIYLAKKRSKKLSKILNKN